ncbi:amidohydrolase, partial [candidate division KSB1 bacterium]|nr:amidohydrolase [candidate division KSB1 bacterium]
MRRLVIHQPEFDNDVFQIGLALKPTDALRLKLTAGRWIIGGNWDHERTFGGVLPTRHMIDSATPNNPVAIGRTD